MKIENFNLYTEYKLGKYYNYNGITLKVKKGSCDCCFFKHKYCNEIVCNSMSRKDNTSIYFEEVNMSEEESISSDMIGQYKYPKDNSWSFTIGTNENPCLAGKSNEFPAKVLIVSKPYIRTIKFLSVQEELEFVTVMYNNQCHVILNQFYNSFYEASAAINKIEMINELSLNY